MKNLKRLITAAGILAIMFALSLLCFAKHQYIIGPWTNLMLIVGSGGLLFTIIVGLWEIKSKNENDA